MRVAWGRCWQHEGAPLLWPWIQALESLADQLSAAELAGGAGRPRRRDRRPAAAARPPPRSGRGNRAGLPGRRAGPALRRRRCISWPRRPRPAPVVLVLEDMHWADPASRELAEYVVGSRVAGGRSVCSSPSARPPRIRPGSAPSCSPRWARSGRGERVDLGRTRRRRRWPTTSPTAPARCSTGPPRRRWPTAPAATRSSSASSSGCWSPTSPRTPAATP